MLALYSGFSGMDLSKEIGPRIGNNGMQGLVEYLMKEDKSLDRLRNIVKFGPQVGRECFLVTGDAMNRRYRSQVKKSEGLKVKHIKTSRKS
jgi:hypothetical protein